MNQTTRERIIQQAIHCMAQNPQASLEEIAAAANVGRATIYRHFKSKAELGIALKLTAGSRLRDTVAPILESGLPALEKFIRIVRELVPLGSSLNVSSFFSLPVKEDHPEVQECYHAHLEQSRQLCHEMIDQGVLEAGPPLAWLMSSMDSLIFAAWEKVQDGDIAPNAAPGLMITTYLNGLGTDKTREWLKQNKEQIQ